MNESGKDKQWLWYVFLFLIFVMIVSGLIKLP